MLRGGNIDMHQRQARNAAYMQQSLFRVQPKRFVFYDKGTGTERFEVKAGPDGRLPVDQAASLMAIHCFVRGKSPKDFGVMVAPEEDLLDSLLPMARSLVQACADNRSPVQLSGRQREVLRAVMQDGSNNENPRVHSSLLRLYRQPANRLQCREISRSTGGTYYNWEEVM